MITVTGSVSQDIKVKKLHPDAVIPSLPSYGNAGIDLTAVSMTVADGYIEFGTGLAIVVPDGHVGLLFPRSSISNTSHFLSNSVGVLDSSYLGEVKFRFRTFSSDNIKVYKIGDRIGQLVVVKLPEYSITEVDTLEETTRGSGGFGSTGR